MIALTIFWLSAGLIAYTYVLFPALVLVRGWIRRRPYKTAEITPTVSLIIAAHNEADGIAARLDNVLSLDYPRDRLEVLVASDGSTDETESIAAGYADRGIKLLSLPRRGKIPTLNAAAAAASGEILVFSDANTTFARDALRALLRPFADEQVGGVAGNQVYTRPDKGHVSGGVVSCRSQKSEVRSQRSEVRGQKSGVRGQESAEHGAQINPQSAIHNPQSAGATHHSPLTTHSSPLSASLTADGECAYWDFDRLMKTAQSRAGSVTSATGAIYALRRSLFRPIPVGVTDDFVASTAAIAQGYRLVFAADALAVEPVAVQTGTEFGRKVRVLTQGLRAIVVTRELLNPFRYGFYAFQLFWHKVLRRLMVFPLVAMLFAGLALWNDGAFYRAVSIAQATFYGCAVLGLLFRGTVVGRLRMFTIPVYFCLVNAAALVAVLNAFRGRRIELWEPQRQPATAAGGLERGEAPLV